MKKFKIYEFNESNGRGNINKAKVKVSTRAEELADKCRKLGSEYNSVLSDLMEELQKDNPSTDFDNFVEEDFETFIGKESY